MTFKIGDTVTLVPMSYLGPVSRTFVGRAMTVTRTGLPFREHDTWRLRHDGVDTAPCPTGTPGCCWRPESLKKIDPPDWQAPGLTTEQEKPSCV